jgi:hypothetical protein
MPEAFCGKQSQLSVCLLRMIDLQLVSFDLFSLFFRFSQSRKGEPQGQIITSA